MTVPTATGLEAAQTWRNLADLWPLLHAYLEPRKSGADTVRTPPASKPPMSLVASDLIQEISNAAFGYAAMLMDETNDYTPSADVPSRLREIAERHGHFTASTDTRIAHRIIEGKRQQEPPLVEILVALDFCNDAHELMRKAVGLIEKPVPKRWKGPCIEFGCEGQLFVAPGRAAATCDLCGADVDPATTNERLAKALDSHLVKANEITTAMKWLGAKVQYSTIRTWIHRGRLVPVMSTTDREGKPLVLYRMTDVMDLAKVRVAA